MDRGRVRSVGNISRVVGMSSGNSIGKGKSIVDLGNGVGISISLGLSLRVSLPFVNVTSISSKSVKSTISSNESTSQTIISSISSKVSWNSFPLANVVCVQAIVTKQSTVSVVSSEVSTVGIDRGRVRSVGNISRVVGMSSGNSIGKG